MSEPHDDQDYLLGHGEREWDRLDEQHQTWRGTLLGTLDRLDLAREGTSVLEVGCGNGALLADLAERVGPSGRAVGVEKDPAAVAQARSRDGRTEWTTCHKGDIYDLDPVLGPDNRFDLVVSRWVLSFLGQPSQAVAQLANRVRPGGHLVVQDYAYDLIRLVPEVPAISHLFRITPKVYEQLGGDAWIALKLPELMTDRGLDIVDVTPHAKAGGPDSPAFRWVRRFFTEHLDSLVETGLITAEDGEASLAGWRQAAATPGSVIFTPVVVDVVGRRPE